MARTDSLHRLVHSLTATEKRYVSLFASRLYEDSLNNQLILFEVLSDLEEYDEDRLLNRLKHSPIKKNLPAEKARLQKMILQAMRIYHERDSVDNQVRMLIAEAEFLLEKRLYETSYEQLEKALRLALEYERRPIALEILRMEATIIKERKHAAMVSGLKANHLRQKEQLLLLEKETDMFILRNEAMANIRKSFNGPAPEEKITPEAEMLTETFNYPFHYYTMLALQQTRSKKYEEAVNTYTGLLQLWENHPHRMESEGVAYKKTLSNFIVVLQATRQYEKSASLIETLQKHPCKNAEEEAEQFQVTAFAQLMQLMNTGQWDQLGQVVRQVEEGFIRYKTKINKAREMAFCYNIGVSWLILSNYKAASAWLERIIAQEKTEHRQDLLNASRLLRLLLYYELEKHDLLEYEVVNVERFLRKRKAWFVYESTVVKLFARLIDTDEKKRPALLQKSEEKIVAALTEKNAFSEPGTSEIQLWIKSKLSGKSMRELLSEVVGV